MGFSKPVPVVYLVRHGETEWSRSGQHTGLTDLPLTAEGEAAALRLGERLRAVSFARVLSSPLQRAWRTCELAGFAATAQRNSDLVEWDYGQYEGRKTKEIKADNPGWDLFRDGGPGGETAAAVAARADRFVAQLRAIDEDVLVFSSGHFSRVLAARWCGLELTFARYLLLGTGSISILGYDHDDRSEPAIRRWNQTS